MKNKTIVTVPFLQTVRLLIAVGWLGLTFLTPAFSQDGIVDDTLDLGFTVPQDFGLSIDTPIAPLSVNSLVVRYETQARVVLNIRSLSSFDSTTIFYRQTNSQTFPILHPMQVYDAHTEYTLPSLPLGGEYELLWYHTVSAQYVPLGSFTTHKLESDVISLNRELYVPLTYWAANPDSRDLYEVLDDITGVSILEKSWFIQQYLHAGEVLPDAWIGILPPKPDGDPLPEGTCICRPLQLTVDESVTPGSTGTFANTTWGQEGTYYPLFKLAEDGSTTTYFGNGHGKAWYAYSYIGASKYQEAWIETKRCVGGWHASEINPQCDQVGDEPRCDPGPENGHVAYLSYSLMCIGAEYYKPEDCPCERSPYRQVSISYKYAADGSSRAEKRDGWCLNGRAANAVAEDVAYISYRYSDDPAGTSTVIDSDRLRSGMGCESDFDEGKFAGNLLKAAFYSYKTFSGIEGVSALTEALFKTYYGTQTTNAISTFFTTNYWPSSGTCGTSNHPGGVLFSGDNFLDLRVNRTLTVMLTSNGRVTARGKGKYRADARLRSSYRLSGVIQPSALEQSGLQCCSNGHGVYSLAEHWPGLNQSTLQSEVRGHFIAQGLNTVGLSQMPTGHWGYRGGGEREGCELTIIDNRLERPEEGRSARPTATLEWLNGMLWVSHQEIELPYTLQVFDIGGKLLHQQVQNDAQPVVPVMQNLNTGIYIAVISSKTQTQALKIYIP